MSAHRALPGMPDGQSMPDESLWLEFVEDKGESAILFRTVLSEDTSRGSSKTRIQYKKGQYHTMTQRISVTL